MTYEQFQALKTWIQMSHWIQIEQAKHPLDRPRIEALERQQEEADATAVSILVEPIHYGTGK